MPVAVCIQIADDLSDFQSVIMHAVRGIALVTAHEAQLCPAYDEVTRRSHLDSQRA